MKPRGGLLFLQRFLMKTYLSHFFAQWASMQASTFMRKSGLLFKYTKKKCTTSEYHSFTGFFMCVLREKWEQRKMKFHCWCLSGKKSRKQRCTHFSSIFAQIQCHSMATVTNDGCSCCCVVTLSQRWLQRY